MTLHNHPRQRKVILPNREYRLYSTIIGENWYGQECWKNFDKKFTRHPEILWAKQISCLRDALLDITKDGDFQNCSIETAELEVSQRYLNEYGHRFKTVTRYHSIRGQDGNDDLFR